MKLADLYETDTHYFLVLQLITGGELFDRIVELVHYSEKDASEIVKKIVLGIQHLHEKNVVHRDLKVFFPSSSFPSNHFFELILFFLARKSFVVF